eukprot:m.174637 g.174637  ORF g.174637 m.174637 type:complete len:1017 (-) comp16541_c0_seq1:891-3941(-)
MGDQYMQVPYSYGQQSTQPQTRVDSRARLHGIMSVSRLMTAEQEDQRPASAEYGVLRVDSTGPGSYHLSPMVLRRHALAQQQIEQERVRRTLQQLKIQSRSMVNLLGKPPDVNQRSLMLARLHRPRSTSIGRSAQSSSPRPPPPTTETPQLDVQHLLHPNVSRARNRSVSPMKSDSMRASYPAPEYGSRLSPYDARRKSSSVSSMPRISGIEDSFQRFDDKQRRRSSRSQEVSLPSLFLNSTTEALGDAHAFNMSPGQPQLNPPDQQYQQQQHQQQRRVSPASRLRNSIDTFLLDPMAGSHHLRDAELKTAFRLTPFTVKEQLMRRMRESPTATAMGDEDSEFMNFVVSLAIHGRKLIMVREERNKGVMPAVESSQNMKKRSDRSACKFCVAIRVGGGFVFVGFAGEDGRCIGCGRYLDFDLSDPNQASMVNWAVQYARHRRKLKNIDEGDEGSNTSGVHSSGYGKDNGRGGRRRGDNGDSLSARHRKNNGDDGADSKARAKGDGDDDAMRRAARRAWESRQGTRDATSPSSRLVNGDGLDGTASHTKNGFGVSDRSSTSLGSTNLNSDHDADGNGRSRRNGVSDGSPYGLDGDQGHGLGHDGDHMGDSDRQGSFDGSGRNGDSSHDPNGDNDSDGQNKNSQSTTNSRRGSRSANQGDGEGNGSNSMHGQDGNNGDNQGRRNEAGDDADSSKQLGYLVESRDRSARSRGKMDPKSGNLTAVSQKDLMRNKERDAAISERLSELEPFPSTSDDDDAGPEGSARRLHKMLPSLSADKDRGKTLQDVLHEVAFTDNIDINESDAITNDAIKYACQYTILDPERVKYYLKVFRAVDVNHDQVLDHHELARGLRHINNNLITDREMDFVLRVLDVINSGMTKDAMQKDRRISFRLFSVVAALSERVTKLDSAVRNKIGTMDYRALEAKLRLAKHLFYVNDLRKNGTISIEALEIEMQAGNLKSSHRQEVLEQITKEGLDELTFLDYLAYIPLFLDIHDAILDNPLDDSRNRDFVSYSPHAR